MRNFRTFSNTPVGNDPSATDYIGAVNINNFLSELEASVSRSGQTLSSDDGTADPDTTQLAKSLFIHSTKATAFQAGGSANAIELTPISGASGVLLPPDYTLLSGMRIVFSPSAANTGAVTVNIGQTAGTLLGAKNLLSSTGSPLAGGELTAGKPVEIQYNGTSFQLLPWSVFANTPVASTAQARAWTDDTVYISPLKLAQALQGSNQSLTTGTAGYQKLPGGFIIQWGVRLGVVGGTNSFSWPISFPNAVLVFTPGELGSSPITAQIAWNRSSTTTSTCVVYSANTETNTDSAVDFAYIAIGY